MLAVGSVTVIPMRHLMCNVRVLVYCTMYSIKELILNRLDEKQYLSSTSASCLHDEHFMIQSVSASTVFKQFEHAVYQKRVWPNDNCTVPPIHAVFCCK